MKQIKYKIVFVVNLIIVIIGIIASIMGFVFGLNNFAVNRHLYLSIGDIFLMISSLWCIHISMKLINLIKFQEELLSTINTIGEQKKKIEENHVNQRRDIVE